MRGIGAALLAIGLFAAGPAEAHIVASRLGDFYAGAMHPLTGLEDVILWLALGLLAGMQPAERGRWVLVLVPAGLVAGLCAGLGGLVPPVLPGWVDAGMMVAVGGLVVLGRRLPAPVLFGLAAGVAAVRGLANATGVAGETNVVLFGAGLAVAGYAVAALTTAGCLMFRQGAGWRSIAVRAAGSWIAAIGIMVGGLALRAG